MNTHRKPYLAGGALLVAMAGFAIAQENIGTVRQGLVGGKIVDAATQEDFGLLAYTDNGGECTASLLRNGWAITAAHCVETNAINPVPNPAKPGQNMLAPLAGMRLNAAWSKPQVQSVVQVETFRPYDVAILKTAGPFTVHGSTTNYSRAIFSQDQFPYFGDPVGTDMIMFGKGIYAFASGQGATAKQAQKDGQFRAGYIRPNRNEGTKYWYKNTDGQMIAGGDSGGPSFAKIRGDYFLVGVHSDAQVDYMPGKPEKWAWVIGVTEAADAPILPVWKQISQIIGPGPMPANPVNPADSAIQRWDNGVVAPFGAQQYATFLYGLQPNGTLVWWRHEGAAYGTDKWRGPRQVGMGWNFKKILPGGGDVIYAITEDGKLVWFRHKGFNNGAGLLSLNRIALPPANGNTGAMGNGGNVLGNNPTGNEILGANNNGGGRRPRSPFRPQAFRGQGRFILMQEANPQPRSPHQGSFYQRSQVPVNPDWSGPVEVPTAREWNQFKEIFAGGDGVIYAVTSENNLLWFKQDDLANGKGPLVEPRFVKRNWNLSKCFSSGDGIIYGVAVDGQLQRTKHLGVQDGKAEWLAVGPVAAQWVNTDHDWNQDVQLFSPGTITGGGPQALKGQVVYSVGLDGKLTWRAQIRMDDRGLGRNWYPPKPQSQNWTAYKQLMALLPINFHEANGGIH